MRFACLLMAGCLGAVTLQVQAATGYSQEYTQCMNFSYGNTAKLQKCVKKELKAQNKRLKKNYKTYLKLNAGYHNNIRDQHTVWQRKLTQQCKLTMNTQYAQIKQGQCALEMVKDQANLYQSRSYRAGA